MSDGQWSRFIRALYPLVLQARSLQAQESIRLFDLEARRFGDDLPDDLPEIFYDLRALDGRLTEVVRDPLARGEDRAVVLVAAEAAVERHVAQSGRDVTVALATSSRTRAIGWARRLTGAENCGFCVMLASRGPVYRSALSASVSRSMRRFHDGCVVGSTYVSGPDAHVGYRRYFEGEVVTLITAAGHELTITPNHPVLTDRGWVRAGLLDETHELVSAVSPDRNVVGGPHEDHVPSRIENLVRALGMMSDAAGLSVPGAAEQFHGDGFDSVVDVVARYDLLGRERDAAFIKPMAELDFHWGSRPNAFGGATCAGHRNLEALLGGDFAPTHGSVGGAYLLETLLGGELRGSGHSGVGSVAAFDSGFIEPSIHHAARDAVLLRESVDAVAGAVLLDDPRRRVYGPGGSVDVPRKFNPPELDSRAETLRVFAEFGADLRERLAGSVHLDRLVDKRVGQFAGHVFNLSTSEGWYSANSITVSNCDCEVVPVYDENNWVGRTAYLEAERRWKEAARGRSGNDALNALRRSLYETPFDIPAETAA